MINVEVSSRYGDSRGLLIAAWILGCIRKKKLATVLIVSHNIVIFLDVRHGRTTNCVFHIVELESNPFAYLPVREVRRAVDIH